MAECRKLFDQIVICSNNVNNWTAISSSKPMQKQTDDFLDLNYQTRSKKAESKN